MIGFIFTYLYTGKMFDLWDFPSVSLMVVLNGPKSIFFKLLNHCTILKLIFLSVMSHITLSCNMFEFWHYIVTSGGATGEWEEAAGGGRRTDAESAQERKGSGYGSKKSCRSVGRWDIGTARCWEETQRTDKGGIEGRIENFFILCAVVFVKLMFLHFTFYRIILWYGTSNCILWFKILILHLTQSCQLFIVEHANLKIKSAVYSLITRFLVVGKDGDQCGSWRGCGATGNGFWRLTGAKHETPTAAQGERRRQLQAHVREDQGEFHL